MVFKWRNWKRVLPQGPAPYPFLTRQSGFRDTKDLRFGIGMASIRVGTSERRDRLWLLSAFAIALLTLLGAAGESLGYDRHLKSNSSKRRMNSLFHQGTVLYELIPMMSEVAGGRSSNASAQC